MAQIFYALFVLATLCLVTCNGAPADNLEIKMPEECHGQQFCPVKPVGYDLLEAKINSVLPDFLIKEYANRDGEDEHLEKLSPEEDWHNCPYITRKQSMFLHKRPNDTHVDVLVQTALYKQVIEQVTCATSKIDTDSNEQCFKDLGVSNLNMKSSCETTQVTRNLLVYDPKKNIIKQQPFKIDACCKCRVSYDI